jgi:hypothetical protein
MQYEPLIIINMIMHTLRNCNKCHKAKKVLDGQGFKYTEKLHSAGRCGAQYPYFIVTVTTKRGASASILSDVHWKELSHMIGHKELIHK